MYLLLGYSGKRFIFLNIFVNLGLTMHKYISVFTFKITGAKLSNLKFDAEFLLIFAKQQKRKSHHKIPSWEAMLVLMQSNGINRKDYKTVSRGDYSFLNWFLRLYLITLLFILYPGCKIG